jgi:4-hydroxybenzoate polyprenyltransferase
MMAASAEALLLPLCVDLDDTLVRSDVQLESALQLLKRNVLYAFLMLFWFLRYGKAGLRSRIAARVSLNAATLPYNHELLAWLEGERARGRSLWLCTNADEKFARSVAQHLGIFQGCIASDALINLAVHKSDRLTERFGAGGFEYCGSEWHSRANWSRPLVRALRPHQWTKNALVLVPLLAAHQIGDLQALANALLGLVAFCLCASSVYVLNDMLDLEADRAHPRKSKRPFAAGNLPLGAAFWLVPALLAAAASIAVFLPVRFQISLAAYYVLTASYSFGLKKMLLVDAVALAGLYTLRVIAGAGAADVALSFWLLLFSVFLFLSLAFVKRYAELDSLRRQQRLQAVGRGYHVEDLSVLQSLGTAAGYLSVLVLALYINSPDIQALYHRPKVIWILCVLMLYWISRVWMTAHRGKMHDDPVVYALKDRLSLVLGLCAAITIAVAV